MLRAFLIHLLIAYYVRATRFLNVMSLSIAIQPTNNNIPNNQRSSLFLPAVKIDFKGKVSSIQVQKQRIANELDLPLRDFRIIDPSFPTQIKSAIIARKQAILFSLENIKVVVRSNEALIFSPFQQESQDFIQQLQQLISINIKDPNQQNLNAKFEIAVIEAALSIVCSNLSSKIRRYQIPILYTSIIYFQLKKTVYFFFNKSLAPAIASALKGLRSESRGLDLVQTQVDELLPLKNKLDDLSKRVKEFKRAINDVLNNDDDMLLICNLPSIEKQESLEKIEKDTKSENLDISSNHKKEINKQNINIKSLELEMLFENYLNEVEWISAEIEEITDEVTNTEGTFFLQPSPSP